jgi:hypothetical protein
LLSGPYSRRSFFALGVLNVIGGILEDETLFHRELEGGVQGGIHAFLASFGKDDVGFDWPWSPSSLQNVACSEAVDPSLDINWREFVEMDIGEWRCFGRHMVCATRPRRTTIRDQGYALAARYTHSSLLHPAPEADELEQATTWMETPALTCLPPGQEVSQPRRTG